MERAIFVYFCRETAFALILHLGLHNAANSDNVARDARVDQVILDLALDRLRHLTCIDIVHVRFNLLDLEPLIEAGSRRVLLLFEYARATVDVDAAIGCLPLTVNETDDNFGLALVACELDGLDEDLDAGYAQDRAPNTNVLVDEVRLAHTHWEDLVEVVEAQNDNSLVREAVDIYAHAI